jgi:DNA-binding transcriptional LysR family regulator
MELRQLEHFVAVAEERSFTKAAQRANIVQSGLSMSIRALEEEVGTRLFERSTRGIVLTPAAEAMLPEARRAIAAVASARTAVDATEGLLRGSLRVGVAQATDPHRVARLLGRFNEDYPGVIVKMHQGNGTTLLDGVIEGKLDLAICGKPIVCPEVVTTVPLTRGKFVFACGNKHAFANLDKVKLGDLAHERFIEMNRGWVSRQHTDHAFGLAGIKRNIICELDDVVLMLQMVEENLGVAVLGGGATAMHPGIKYIPIHPAMSEWEFVVAFMGDKPANVAARVFLIMTTREWLSGH